MSSIPTSSPSSMSAPAQSAGEQQENKPMRLAIIIVLSVAALAFLLTLILGLWIYSRRRRVIKAEHAAFSEATLLYSRPPSPSNLSSRSPRMAEEWKRDETRPSWESADTVQLLVGGGSGVPRRDIPIVIMPLDDDENEEETDHDRMRVVVTLPTPVDGDIAGLSFEGRGRVDAIWGGRRESVLY